MLKGNITRVKTAIEKIPKTRENLKNIVIKLEATPQLLVKVCTTHEHLVQQLESET